jgi:hypothetical protein
MLIKKETPLSFHEDEGTECSMIIKIDDSNREEILNIVKQEKLVIVHCNCPTVDEEKMTLSNETYLWDELIGHKSKVLYADGIVSPPEWQAVRGNSDVRFDLYFEPFPKECKLFMFWEQIREPYAFSAFNIKRNENDEYWVRLHCCPF